MKETFKLTAPLLAICAALTLFSCDDISDYIDSYIDPDKSDSVTAVYTMDDIMDASFSNQMGTSMWLTIGFYENEEYVEGTSDADEQYMCNVHAESLNGVVDQDYWAYATWEENGTNRYNVYTSGGTSNVVTSTDEEGNSVYDTWDDTIIIGIRSPDEIVLLSGKMNNWQTKATLERE